MDKAQRASLLLRVAGKGVDVILIFALIEILPRTGFLAGLGYMLIADGFSGGKSLGKRLLGLAVFSEEGGRPCTVKRSILRNFILALGLLLWKIPLAGPFLTAAVFFLEFIVLIGSPAGKRIGDEIAKTRVLEARYEEAV